MNRKSATETQFPHINAYYQRAITDKEKPEIYPGELLSEKQFSNGSTLKFIRQPAICEDWTLKQIVECRPPLGWIEVFKDAWKELIDIDQKLETNPDQHIQFYPLKKNLFRVFELCPLNKVKVVIIGQDPYHSVDHDGQPTAQGMSFSVRKEARIPPSLRNIYQRLAETVPEFVIPTHGDLSGWVMQGIFLLNTDLTVLPGQPGSHKGYWGGFLNRVLKAIGNQNSNVIYLLWGKHAQKTVKSIIGQRGIILETSHPSPLGIRYGFNKCDHFNEVNRRLIKLKKKPIDWQIY